MTRSLLRLTLLVGGWVACCVVAATAVLDWPVHVFGPGLRWGLCIIASEFAIAGLTIGLRRISTMLHATPRLRCFLLVAFWVFVGTPLAIVGMMMLPFASMWLCSDGLTHGFMAKTQWERVATWDDGITQCILWHGTTPLYFEGAYEVVEIARRVPLPGGNGLDIVSEYIEVPQHDDVKVEATADGHRITILEDDREVSSVVWRHPR